MTAVTLPNVGIQAGFTEGESGWSAAMNRNLRVVDALVQPRVVDKDLTAPPSASAGDVYIVAASATGDWAGQDGKLAIWCVGDDLASEWVFVTPKSGWFVWVVDESKVYRYTGSAWVIYTASASVAAADITDGTPVGRAVMTAADALAARTAIGAGTSNFSGAYADLTGEPTLGTASALNVAASGDAAAGEVVKGNDARLSDARTPTAHNQALSTITQSGATTGQVPTWNGTDWAPATPTTGGMTNPMTDAGDLIVGGASGAPTRLGISTNGYVLTLASGVPVWAAASGGGGAWGSITGTLSAQTDLQAALDAKAPLGVIAQNSQSTAYTLVLADAGKHILHPSADTTARTFTIPANSSVAFPVGTVVSFVNQNAAGVVTIAITTDTMRLAVAGTTGSRTLAANGVATALKLAATEWLISGVGLT